MVNWFILIGGDSFDEVVNIEFIDLFTIDKQILSTSYGPGMGLAASDAEIRKPVKVLALKGRPV